MASDESCPYKCGCCNAYLFHGITFKACGHSFCRNCASKLESFFRRGSCLQCKKTPTEEIEKFVINTSLGHRVYAAEPRLLINALRSSDVKFEKPTAKFIKGWPSFRDFEIGKNSIVPVKLHLCDPNAIFERRGVVPMQDISYHFRCKSMQPCSVFRTFLARKIPPREESYMIQIIEPTTLQILADSATLQDVVCWAGWDRVKPINLYFTCVILPPPGTESEVFSEPPRLEAEEIVPTVSTDLPSSSSSCQEPSKPRLGDELVVQFRNHGVFIKPKMPRSKRGSGRGRGRPPRTTAPASSAPLPRMPAPAPAPAPDPAPAPAPAPAVPSSFVFYQILDQIPQPRSESSSLPSTIQVSPAGPSTSQAVMAPLQVASKSRSVSPEVNVCDD